MMDEQGKTPQFTETQTRKTVKLPAASAIPGNFEETQTRKTVKLKPAVPPSSTASRPVHPVIASPLRGRDTDTGNLTVMANTQTRKTVKLRPISKPAVNIPEIQAPAGAVAAPASTADDVTRKVGKIRPAAKTDISLPPPAPAPSEPVAAPASTADDVTRKVSKISSKKTMVLPGAVPVDGDTSKKTMVLPDEEEESPTVRIVRPAKKPVIGPAPAVKPPAAEKPVESAPTPPAPIKLSLKKTEESGKAEEEKKAPSLKLKLKSPAEKPAETAAEAAAEEETGEESVLKAAETPSVAVTVLAAAAAVLLLLSAGLSAVSYFNVHAQQRISIPGLSVIK